MAIRLGTTTPAVIVDGGTKYLNVARLENIHSLGRGG